VNKSKIFIKTIFGLLLIIQFNSYAMDTVVQIHKGDQSGTSGFTLGLTDSITSQGALNWGVSYNRLTDVVITWNNDDIDFSLDTVDFTLSYRYSPKSYNKLAKSLIFEFQAGVGVAVTENKFSWPDLNEEKFFSEQGDVNGVVAFLLHKKLSKQMSIHFGVKHYLDYSEFGDLTSAFIGFNYRFGKQVSY